MSRNILKTFVRFFRDVADDAGDAMIDVLRVSNYDTIKEGAKNSMAIFPMICSQHISDMSLSTLIKGLEREYASYLMLLLTSNDIIDISQDERKGDMLDRLGVTGHLGEGEEIELDFFNHLITEEDRKSAMDSHGGYLAEKWETLQKELYTTNKTEYNFGVLNRLSTGQMYLTEDEYIKSGEFLRNSDMKKFSEMQPTIMQVTITYVNDGGTMQSTAFTFGVKAQPHLVDTSEMVINLKKAFKGGNFMFRAIRWLTGEKKFISDFLMDIGGSKEHVAITKTSKIKNLWFNIHMLRNVSRIRKVLSTYPTLPTTTIIITKDEAEELKSLHGIDIYKPVYLNRIFNEMFIMGFIILDEAIGSVKVYNYENSTWMDYSLDYIKKENDMTNNLVKSIVDLTKR